MEHHTLRARLAILPFVFALAAACGEAPSKDLLAGSNDGTDPESSLGNRRKGGSGEACGVEDTTRSCCTTGTQTCVGTEIRTWGPCLDDKGAPLGCEGTNPGGSTGDGTKPPTGSTGDGTKPDGGGGGTKDCGPGMSCKPGAIRYCDVPGTEWTKSTCTAAGQWGPCVATAPLTNDGCDANDYSPELCCPPLKLCCQDNPGGPYVDFGSGACAAIMCAAR